MSVLAEPQRDAASTPSTAPTARRIDRAMFVVLVLALAYFAFDKFMLAPRREAAVVAAGAQAQGEGSPNAPRNPCASTRTRP